MDFLKKHYEKILLGVMLFVFIGVLVFMLFYIADQKSAMEERRNSILSSLAKPLAPLDTTLEEGAMARVSCPIPWTLNPAMNCLTPWNGSGRWMEL